MDGVPTYGGFGMSVAGFGGGGVGATVGVGDGVLGRGVFVRRGDASAVERASAASSAVDTARATSGDLMPTLCFKQRDPPA